MKNDFVMLDNIYLIILCQNLNVRLFKLRLKPDLDTLGGNEMYFDGVSAAFDLSHIYKGFIDGK